MIFKAPCSQSCSHNITCLIWVKPIKIRLPQIPLSNLSTMTTSKCSFFFDILRSFNSKRSTILSVLFFEDIEYRIKDENNLRKKCEKALSIIPNNEGCNMNIFLIKKEQLDEVITQWQLRYPE